MMKNQTKKICFNGKRIRIRPASTKRVASLAGLSDTFMKRIVGLEPCDYLITDESRLSDFTEFDSGDISCYLDKIKKIYKIDVSDIPNGNLSGILMKLRSVQKGIKTTRVQRERARRLAKLGGTESKLEMIPRRRVTGA